MSNPLVTVIVTTRNNHKTLDACLASIVNQAYEPIELIVVDRDSSDGTKMIARYYTSLVFNCGPERSAQRNFAVSKASGEYVVIIDSDMELTPHVIQDCVDTMHYRPQTSGIIIPEESFGQGFWAQCKSLERSFYHGNDAIEAARFFAKSTYQDVGGYDETMVSGEDWDLSARVRNLGKIERISSIIRHNEGNFKLIQSLRKKYYYAGQAKAYLRKNKVGNKLTASSGPIARYKLFFSRPGKLLVNPFLGFGMLFMKTCEFGFGAVGYLTSSKKERA
ncbi:MAG TPA: glycosyltransferase [Patescibacteria group bacterium]|nr:glycosyltransferase [Patescibacteria group bacterium]